MSPAVLASLAVLFGFMAAVGPPDRGAADRVDRLVPSVASPSLWQRIDDDLRRRLVRADLARLTGHPLLAWLGLTGLLVGGGLVMGSRVGAALGALVGLVAPPVVLAVIGDRWTVAVDRSLPEALELIARSLRSGSSLTMAVGENAAAVEGPLGVELTRVAGAVARGLGLPDALDDLAARVPTPAVRLTVAALALGAEAGGTSAMAIDGVAASLRDQLAVNQEIAALSSQARASAAVIAGSPLAFMVLAIVTDPETGRTLFRTPLGLTCLGAGLCLDGIGLWWMRRVTGGSP